MRRWTPLVGIGLLAIILLFTAFGRASAAETLTVRGKILDAGTGLALSGVVVQTEGPTIASTTSDSNGNFVLPGLMPGYYNVLMRLNGYVTTESEPFHIAAGAQTPMLTLVLQRGQGFSRSTRVLGVTTIRAAASLQKAATVYTAVSAEPLQQQGFYRVSDYIQQLPGLQGGNPAQPADDVSLNIRGIGTLETLTMIDGHPIGPRGNYNYELSPVFGLRSVDIFYGSGGSDLYGVNAIGGVVNMQTLDPTITPQVTVSQSYGTWSKLATAIQATGTQPGGKIGYALAYGTQGLDGPFHHDLMYQASASSDPFSTDPAVRAAATYIDDNAFVNRSGLAKLAYNFSSAAHLTTTLLSSYEWDNKTGNGDNDYLPYQVQLAAGQSLLAKADPKTDKCTAGNPNTFTVVQGDPCQTPQSYANNTFGYQGAGPAWQSYNSNDYDVKYENAGDKNTFAVDAFSNFYFHTYDRTFELPCCSPFWRNLQDTNTGFSISDDVQTPANDVGLGYFFENTASLYRIYTGDPNNLSTPPSIAGPITHDNAFFVRDAYHAPASDLTTYLNVWFKNSTITNTSYVDPRIAFVLNKSNDVYRAAIGRTSAQPTPDMLDQPFSPTALGAFTGGGLSCTALNSLGNVPSSSLKPEQATDEELSYGHRFSGDSTAQLTLYNTNLFGQIYGTTAPLSSVSLPGFDPSQYAHAVGQFCGISDAAGAALLGVSGNVNIGHTIARGIQLTGRERLSNAFFIDYMYDTQSALLQSQDPSLINPADGGQLIFVPGSQLPNIPLHKYSYSFDYTFGGKLEARLDTFNYSTNNANNLPAYSYSNLSLTRPIGPSSVSVSVDNLFNQNADYRNEVGLGVPLALNKYATAQDYQPYFGTAATELFHLPYRTVLVEYSTHIR